MEFLLQDRFVAMSSKLIMFFQAMATMAMKYKGNPRKGEIEDDIEMVLSQRLGMPFPSLDARP